MSGIKCAWTNHTVRTYPPSVPSCLAFPIYIHGYSGDLTVVIAAIHSIQGIPITLFNVIILSGKGEERKRRNRDVKRRWLEDGDG